MIAAVDEFILYDDMQYTKRDWRNRNQIKTPQGTQWISVPVNVKGKFHQKIRDAEIDGTGWAQEHWSTIMMNYRKSKHFDEIAEWLAPLYLETHHSHISHMNRLFIESICSYLKIGTKISNSWDYGLIEGKSERLADLCKKAGGTEYISGPSAKNYIDDDVFKHYEIKLQWFDYAGYREYPQLWGEFTHGVTILDLLFNCGSESRSYMKY